MERKRLNISEGDSILQNKDLLYKITSFQYSEPLRHIMESSVFVCRVDDPVQTIARQMAEKKISSVVVTDEKNTPVGIVTERDMVRKIVAADPQCGAEKNIDDIMTPHPICLSPRDSLFDALSLLSRYSIKHLPVVDRQKIVGIITLRQIIKIRYSEPLVIIAQLQKAKTVSDFKLIKEEMIPLVQEKLETNTDPVDIVTMLSLINASIHKRLLNTILNEYKVPPPADFCVFVTGSHGRKENLIFPDQDFCVIIEDYDDKYHNEIDTFFRDVSQKLSDRLNAVGFDYCSGKIMGQNPLWRKRITDWKRHVSEIIGQRGEYTIRYMTLIFDSAPLFGNRALFDQYINHAYKELSHSHNVLRQMHDEEEGRHRVPLGLFRTFITEKEEAHRGELDMKRSGLIFIIESSRILALRHGIRETSTLGRIKALVRKHVIHRDDSEYFENAYRVMLYHTLKAQVDNFMKNGTHDYYLNPGELSARGQEMLKQAFRAVSRFQDLVGSEFGELIL